MKMQFEELLGRVTDFLQNEANTKTVVGEPFTLGEFSCIPVVRVGMGFGTGGGEGDDKTRGHGEGGGAGAGMGIEPIGFLVARGSDLNFVSTRVHKGLSAAFEQVPGLIEKYFEMKKEEAALV